MAGTVEFVTLFLSLITGVHPVTVAVEGEVTRVELRLDGELLGVLDGEPWTLECDLGRDLEPHELLAVGFDARGREIARAKQRINLPRPRAEARLVLHDDDGGPPNRVGLTWDTVEDVDPYSIRVTLDDQPLLFDDPGDIPLPSYDPRQPHFLSAELIFRHDLEARTTASFGGQVGLELSAELTAIPIVAAGSRSKPPAPRKMSGWFSSRGSELSVFAIEKTPADVLLVVDHEAWGALFDLRILRRNRFVSASTLHPAKTLPPGLRRDDRFRMVATSPDTPSDQAPSSASDQKLLFPISGDFNAKHGPIGIATALLRLTVPPGRPTQYLADAVAVAGLTAARGERPRAVVFISKEGSRDASRRSPESIRAFLQKLRVPLYVWYVSEPSAANAWGDGFDLSRSGELKAALKALRRDLDAQYVVWLEGSHLPQSVEVNRPGWRIAG